MSEEEQCPTANNTGIKKRKQHRVRSDQSAYKRLLLAHALHQYDAILAEQQESDAIAPLGSVVGIVRNLDPSNLWITRSDIYSALKRREKLRNQNSVATAPGETPPRPAVGEDPEPLPPLPSTPPPLPSLEKNNNNNKKRKQQATSQAEKEALEQAMVLACSEYSKVKTQAKQQNTKLAKGTLGAIVKRCEQDAPVPITINIESVRKRVIRNNIQGINRAAVSPMSPVEDELKKLCREHSMITGNPRMDAAEFLDLAHARIRGTSLEQDVIAWTAQISRGKANSNTASLSMGYYYNFMKRHGFFDDTSERKVPARKKAHSVRATTDEMTQMYNRVYARMVQAGVAQRLAESTLMDEHGQTIESNDGLGMSVGLPVDTIVTHPQYTLFLDLSQTTKTTTSEWNTFAITAATGEPVMCCVIVASEPQESALQQDSTRQSNANAAAAPNDAIRGSEDNGAHGADSNTGHGQVFSSGYSSDGPMCHFRDKQTPCFVASSPDGRMTPPILTALLTRLDELELFPRNGVNPFLLLDGHEEPFRLDLAFLQYVCDEKHPWTVALSLGTHLLDDVANNDELKTSLQVAEAEAKERVLQRKIQVTPLLGPDDIMPIVKYAFPRSLGRIDLNKKRLCQKGMNPLNRNLKLRISSTKL